ncbi:hypothetical protein AB6V29_02560 [Microbacterium sp. 20-116]|uniref:hypothetical protein n=1 Tax=Microbacterium sp. 20-116 TaxID=3239883 RepID=UPI0034E1A423
MSDDTATISDLQRYFFKQLSEARTDHPADVPDIAIVPLLDAWASCLEWATRAKLTEEERRTVAEYGTTVQSQYEGYGQTHGSAQRSALRAMGGALHVFESMFVVRGDSGVAGRDERILQRKIDRAIDSSDIAWSVMAHVTQRFDNMDHALDSARGAVTEAKRAASEAREALAQAEKAATKSATGALEQSFATTAENNNTVAWAFRIGTLVTLGIIIVLAGTYVIGHSPSANGNVDWYAVTYRIAILSAFGVLAGYLGRQAGNYTRLATWAHGIQIQLKAFRGFVIEIEDPEARQTMYALFGKRVLESPPDGKSSGDEGPTNLIQPIFEQAAKLR